MKPLFPLITSVDSRELFGQHPSEEKNAVPPGMATAERPERIASKAGAATQAAGQGLTGTSQGEILSFAVSKQRLMPQKRRVKPLLGRRFGLFSDQARLVPAHAACLRQQSCRKTRQNIGQGKETGFHWAMGTGVSAITSLTSVRQRSITPFWVSST